MGVWVVDPDWYFSTAAIMGQAAEELANQMGIAEDILTNQTTTMAGDDPIGAAWGAKYDTACLEVLDGVRAVCTAWSGIGMRLYEAGVNHAWAEIGAGRGQWPTTPNLPAKPPLREPQVATPPSSVGNNGPGLDEVLPGLTNLIGTPVPNGDTEELSESALAFAQLSVMVTTTCESVLHRVKRPPADLPDGSAFYESITSITAPAQTVATDALTLAAHCETFSTALTTMRANIETTVNATGVEISAYVIIGATIIIATRLSGTGFVVKEFTPRVIEAIENCADLIRIFIGVFESEIARMGSYTAAFNAAQKAILNKFALVPADGPERLPDGTTVPTTRYFPPAKAAAWERYLERGGDYDIDRWSNSYDQLATNAANGYRFDQYAANTMGYDTDGQWKSQYRDPDIPGRRYDFANIWYDSEGNRTGILVENKSGAIDWDQLNIDTEAMSNGFQVVWNINAHHNYSAADMARLQELVETSGGRFVLNEI